MLLKNKHAVVYGAGGAIGSAAAKAFAAEGAHVYLTGRRRAPLEAVAKEIEALGGKSKIALVDTFDDRAVEEHFSQMVEEAGQVDISFNAISIPQTGVQGIPLLELSVDQFLHPIDAYARSYFNTSKAAAKHMSARHTGVIILLTATPARFAAPLVGGMPAAWSTLEALTRNLAGELGPQGVRVVCLRPAGIPGTDIITEVYGLHAKAIGMPSHKEFQSLMEELTLLKRLPSLDQVGKTVAFIASDGAGAITGTVLNLSGGSVMD
jgi:NAD(P)-dependent dehydrogenase (short-subunit alcohol dehydrogenase family)